MLSFWFDKHIPTTLNRNNLRTELEYIYQNITNDISHLSEVMLLKVILVILKFPINIRELLALYNEIQGKESGVVILDKNIYVKKCLSILGTNQFMKLDKNPTSSYESEIQCKLRKKIKTLNRGISKSLSNWFQCR